MFRNSKAHGQSGFFSVESIANALFYLIMIAVATLIASKVMNSGKSATTATALSILRVNVQYVGTMDGGYTNVGALSLPMMAPGLVKDLAAPAAGQGILPTSETVTLAPAAAGDPDENGVALAAVDPNYFKMSVATVRSEDCRKLAYYGVGAGYGVMVNSVIVTKAATVTGVETNCIAAATVPVVLTSR